MLGHTFPGWILMIIKLFKKIVAWDCPRAFGSWTPCGRLGEEIFYLKLSIIVNNCLNVSELAKFVKIFSNEPGGGVGGVTTVGGVLVFNRQWPPSCGSVGHGDGTITKPERLSSLFN